jgi:hypothetical protein
LNFDSFQQSFKAVLLMSTNMYWPNIMYSAVDSTSGLQAPIHVMPFISRRDAAQFLTHVAATNAAQFRIQVAQQLVRSAAARLCCHSQPSQVFCFIPDLRFCVFYQADLGRFHQLRI